jgi:hypothetical protein
MPSIRLQVVAPVPTNFFHCMHCEQFFQLAGIGENVHRAEIEQYPETVIQDATRLAEWLFDLAQRYGDRLRIQLIDPQSLQGFFFCLRFWVRSYPAFIMKGRKAYVGWDRKALDRIMQAQPSKLTESPELE